MVVYEDSRVGFVEVVVGIVDFESNISSCEYSIFEDLSGELLGDLLVVEDSENNGGNCVYEGDLIVGGIGSEGVGNEGCFWDDEGEYVEVYGQGGVVDEEVIQDGEEGYDGWCEREKIVVGVLRRL